MLEETIKKINKITELNDRCAKNKKMIDKLILENKCIPIRIKQIEFKNKNQMKLNI